MKSCCVEGCEIKSEDVIFFEFPTSRSLRRRWLDVVKLCGKLPAAAAVCSQHFEQDDYETVRGKVRLKRKVVPSLMLDDKVQNIAETPPSPTPEATETTSLTPPPETIASPPETPAPPPETTEDHSITQTSETEHSKTNGTDGDGNSDSVASPLNPIPEEPDPKQDIEEMITNYQIKNNPNSELAARISEDLRASAREHRRASTSEREPLDASELVEVEMTPDLIMLPEVEPCYIEVPVDKDLSNYSNSQLEDVSIKASVSIRSLRHGNNRHGYFYIDLRDDSGDIPAVAYTENEPCDNQLHLIQDNRTYIITNITLTNSNKRYTSIPHEKEIVLTNNTVVKLCGNASKVEWPLTPLNEVYDQDEPSFFNIVGLCTGVTETEIVSGEPQRRVTLVDEARSEVVLTVWSQETSLFDELDLNFHPVLFVKDARIHKYRGTTSVTTSRYLQLLHPDDPRAVKIRRIMQGSPPKNSTAEPNLNADRTVARIAPSQPAGYPYCTPANFIRNNQKYYHATTIADLASLSSSYSWTLIATVTIKSVRLASNENEYFYMDLRDDSGEIVAYVSADACVKFQNFIEKNKTYIFTGFKFGTFKERFTSIPHQKVLILDNDSDVKLCGTAPRVEWPLSPLTVVHAEDKTEFFQAFGLYTGIKRRMVTLVDQLDRELFVQLTDKKVAMFDALDLESRPVIFVKDATMSNIKHKGNKILRTGWYLELLEPDDPRARRVTEAVGNAHSAPVHRSGEQIINE